ncbi:CHAT domain-containing protein [Clohesyomyces aquaticus]|uniref:CHAT domain-containing protein n=1 Tax=Clohesyomyces aquaticus TaxID=1231657 RepID=A0A1Y1YGB4_9PLEO|nr:CHAT domain-containing protein [Clohesyomyces aquaticus]
MEAGIGKLPNLPEVKKEARTLCSLLPKPEQMTTLDRPTVSKAIEAIKENDVVHLACHGVAVLRNPTRSYLALAKSVNGTETIDRLYVRQILETKAGAGGIAFLSACHTADTDPNLGDEAIHMATAFQMAGFSHVVGTMWNTRNRACRDITTYFYENIFKGAQRVETITDSLELDVAKALHDAVQRFAKTGQKWRNPLLWASFSHFGA